MLNKKALASAPSTPPVFVEDVFSTYLYTGNSSTQTITNGIDLSGKGGLVWIKSRSDTTSNFLFDTIRGALNEINSNNTEAQVSLANSLTAFNANGFSLGSSAQTNFTGETQVSWTFRKQAKFFDVVTYTGNGSTQNIAHSLGSAPGCIIVKCTSTAGQDWFVYHQTQGNGYGLLNTTDSWGTYTGYWNNTTPTSTQFSVGTSIGVNGNGLTYVAYLFAHDAGGFGTAGTDNVISCGSFTADGGGYATVNLGYEPQFLIAKATNAEGYSWRLIDTMRGWSHSLNDKFLTLNSSSAEGSDAFGIPTATGFEYGQTGANTTFIYIAIRRGPMKTPTSGTSVFSPLIRNGTGATAVVSSVGFPPDLYIGQQRPASSNAFWADRLRGRAAGLKSTDANAETTSGSTADVMSFDQNGVTLGTGENANINPGNGNSVANWNFRRAPGFFDVVCYTGTGSARTVTHSLGVVPEMMIVKNRSTAANWMVYHKGLNGGTSPQSYFINLNLTTEETNNTGTWNNTAPTSSVFSVGSAGNINNTSDTYVAYLFATVTGVSKVGFYTGTGTTLTIDCGFTAGARFVLIKCADNAGNWFVWDTARGIVSGDDPYLLLNSTAAEVTNTDYIDPVNSGFQISSTAPAAINQNNGKFIFIAIA